VLTSLTAHFKYNLETSATRGIKSVVPQGAILSLLLFNVIMRDLPSVPVVSVADYANDIAFFTSSHDVIAATGKIQSQLRAFYNWTKQWGLTLNLAKTKCMVFTNKQATVMTGSGWLHPKVCQPIQVSGSCLGCPATPMGTTNKFT
jgi:hypothetical protein